MKGGKEVEVEEGMDDEEESEEEESVEEVIRLSSDTKSIIGLKRVYVSHWYHLLYFTRVYIKYRYKLNLRKDKYRITNTAHVTTKHNKL